MDTDELQGMMTDAMIALRDLRAVDDRAHRLILDEIQRIWDDHAELRDEIHAVANRVETLTRAMMIDAGEVAEKMIAANTLRVVKPYDQDVDGRRLCSSCGGSGHPKGLHAACSICNGTGYAQDAS